MGAYMLNLSEILVGIFPPDIDYFKRSLNQGLSPFILPMLGFV